MKYYEQMEFTTFSRNFIHKTGISDDSENHRLTTEQQHSQNTQILISTILAINHTYFTLICLNMLIYVL